jgi:tetratricopeptide (TPR) repeat protein
MIAASLAIERAFTHFRQGDLAAAEALLAPLETEATALHLLGVLRVRQGRLPEADLLLRRSISLGPHEAQSRFNHGKVLAALGRDEEAVTAFRAALMLDKGQAQARLLLARSLRRLGRFDEATAAYRTSLEDRPDAATALALGDLLIGQGKPAEATGVLTQGLSLAAEAPLGADLHQALALAKRRDDPAAALAHLDEAQKLDPARTALDGDRAALMEEAHRFQEAGALYRRILARDPANVRAHEAYNELLYRLGDDDRFLSSYEAAPATPELLLAKARLLLAAGRGEEAEAAFGQVLRQDSGQAEAALGLGLAQLKQGAAREAALTLENAARRWPSANILGNLSGVLAQLGDPAKAAVMAERALEAEPHNQAALAMLGTSWRLMGDERDELLNGYDRFVQIFELEPPSGFSDMASFNAELDASLDRLHPPVREYLRQSLRGGTQTSDNLFGTGHALVEKLRRRIAEAVQRYIEALPRQEHAFLARRTGDFAFAGSWSSRLRDQGFHINHLHPGGWISSCYYVALPEAVRDEQAQQGWITFGAPSFDVGLQPRRTIQPAAGRLILFPSFMWHGTNPFRDACARTTIAFDVVPA